MADAPGGGRAQGIKRVLDAWEPAEVAQMMQEYVPLVFNAVAEEQDEDLMQALRATVTRYRETIANWDPAPSAAAVDAAHLRHSLSRKPL